MLFGTHNNVGISMIPVPLSPRHDLQFRKILASRYLSKYLVRILHLLLIEQ